RLDGSVNPRRSADGEMYGRITENAARRTVFGRDNLRGSAGRELQIEIEIVNSMAFEFVLNDKGLFVAVSANGSKVDYSKREISGVRGAQETVSVFRSLLDWTDSRFVSQDEES